MTERDELCNIERNFVSYPSALRAERGARKCVWKNKIYTTLRSRYVVLIRRHWLHPHRFLFISFRLFSYISQYIQSSSSQLFLFASVLSLVRAKQVQVARQKSTTTGGQDTTVDRGSASYITLSNTSRVMESVLLVHIHEEEKSHPSILARSFFFVLPFYSFFFFGVAASPQCT